MGEDWDWSVAVHHGVALLAPVREQFLTVLALGVRAVGTVNQGRGGQHKALRVVEDRGTVAVDHPQDAVQGCQIVTCATAAMDPCFDGGWLEPGSHVTAITSPDRTTYRRELDDVAFDRADLLIALSKEQIEYDRQVDIMGPVKRGLKTWEQIGELGDLLVGRFPGRSGRDQITLFANNTGMGIQFAAVGARVLELAKAKGLGREVPTEWFLEETTP